MSEQESEWAEIEVFAALELMSLTGYPCGEDDTINEAHSHLGVDRGDYGVPVREWLASLSTARRAGVIATLEAEIAVIERAKANHPSSRKEQHMILPPPPPPVPSRDTATSSAPEMITEALVVPERRAEDATAVAEIDSLIASVKDRTLVPTTEFIDRLLDLRNAIDRDAARIEELEPAEATF